MKNNNRPENGLAGLAVLGLCLVGVCSAVGAVIAIVNEEFIGSGILAIASALSFGMLLNALLRK